MRARVPALLLCGLAASLLAAPPAPPGPETFNARLRYAINATGNDRIEQYRDFRAALKKAGFTRDADEEEAAELEAADTSASRMTGTIPANKVADLLKVRFARSVLLWPEKTKLPGGDTRARVDLRLTSGYQGDFQHQLSRQTAAALATVGFVEAVGYDHQGHTRLVGSVPGESLPKLLDDVRQLVPRDERESPFRLASPVRLTVVQPTWPVPSGAKKLPDVPRGQEKFSPDLRPLLGGDARQRLEVILARAPAGEDWQQRLQDAGATVEGRTGQLVTVMASPKASAKKLADLPEVVALRLPRRAAQAPLLPGTAAPARWEALDASGVTSLHARGHRGKGARIVLIADDFGGWQNLKGAKLLDLTAARSRDLLPDPTRADTPEGHGTRCARAILKTAPEAELTLARVDAAAPYMLEEVARAINGEPRLSLAMAQRFAEQKADRELLAIARDRLEELRNEAISDDDLDEAERRKLRERYRAAQKKFDADEDALRQREKRALALQAALDGLKGARVVASALVWPDGHPVDGTSALSRYFDDRPFRAALWFQAAGDTAGQAWSGPFRDADGNGLVEMGDPKRLPRGSWTPELNFLGWQTAAGRTGPALPAGARLRLTLQWREAHDPAPLRAGADPYRTPLANLRLVVVYQPDPDGKARPADDLEVVTSTVGAPQRLAQSLTSATYEHSVELDVKQPGRYAVYIEGTGPESIHAPGEGALPDRKKRGEVNLRLFVRALAGKGRAVWSDFATKTASLGMPADARQVITVAAATADGAAQPASAGGSPPGVSLLVKPDALAYDEGEGTAHAASFAAGLAAAALPRTGGYVGFLELLRERRGKLLQVPGAKATR